LAEPNYRQLPRIVTNPRDGSWIAVPPLPPSEVEALEQMAGVVARIANPRS